MAYKWTEISNGENALSVRTKLNALGVETQSLDTQVTNLATTVSSFTASIIIINNATVATNSWLSDSTYENYPYKASISVSTSLPSGASASDYIPFVMFSAKDQESGNFAGADTTATSVDIYCTEKPNTTITIPQILLIGNLEG